MENETKKPRKSRKRKNPEIIRKTICIRLLPKHIKVLRDKAKRTKKSIGKTVEILIWGK